MWKTVHDSVVGTSHQVTGNPCQDSHRVVQFASQGRETLIVVCADGAGSAKHSDRGSAFVCDTIIGILRRELATVDNLNTIGRETAVAWCAETRDGLIRLASEVGCEIRDLASTVLAAVIVDDSSLFMQLGDGAIVSQYDGLYEVIFWPQSGEYANVTNFLTDESYDKRLEFSTRKGATVTALAMFTDGLERLILHYAERTVHVPFLEPLFKALQDSASSEDLFEPMRLFLSSERVNQRTDDDKTLVLATRLTTLIDGNATR